jgi:membrane protein YdbS with pleckstrin-like domain
MNMVLGCTSCSQSECPLSDNECSECADGHQVITGWMFSLVCALVFILPIMMAAVGSLIFSNSKAYSLVAGIAGFVLGSMISTWITRFCSIEK